MSKLLDVAKAEIGNKESDGGDDKYIKWYGGLTLFVAWCAIFVSWVAARAGVPRTVIPKFASCDEGVKWFKLNRRYRISKAYGGDYVPKQNDLIFFSSKETQNDSTHVGYVDSVGNAVVHTVEGNSSDAVRSRTYELSSRYIIGYGVVDLIDATPLVSKEVANLIKALNKLPAKPTLQRGSTGAVVRLVQKVLISRGYSCGKDGADGILGIATEVAIIRFQREVVGMTKPDGVITSNEATWKALLT